MLNGDAAKNINAINSLAEQGGPVDDVASLFRKLNHKRVNPGELWTGLSEAAKGLLGLEFVGGAIMRARRNGEVSVGTVGGVLKRLAGDAIAPSFNERMARHKLAVKSAVKASQLPALLHEAQSPTDRIILTTRCASATRVPLQGSEYSEDAWSDMAKAAQELNLSGINDSLQGEGFSLNAPTSPRTWEVVPDQENASMLVVSLTTGLLTGSRDVTLSQWKGSSVAAAKQIVSVNVVDYFNVSLAEVSAYLPDAKAMQNGVLHPDVQNVLSMALAAQETSILTPLASVVSASQEVAKVS